MRPFEAFGIVVRAIGLIIVVSALVQLILAVTAPGILFLAIPELLLGLWLLRGAKAVVSFAYPGEDRQKWDAP